MLQDKFRCLTLALTLIGLGGASVEANQKMVPANQPHQIKMQINQSLFWPLMAVVYVALFLRY